jgi:DNA-binding NtrC family response regulator
VSAGRFRKDLFYRLNAVSIVLPPLRDRLEDILPLARTFAAQVHSLNPVVRFSAEALALLQQYSWPGNIRELENAIVRAAAMCEGTIRVQDLPERMRSYGGTAAGEKHVEDRSDLPVEDWPPLAVIEGRYVSRVLDHTGGNKQAAARTLDVDRKTLDRMIKRHGIDSRKANRSAVA